MGLLDEKLDVQGRPKKNPGYVVLPLLAYAEYIDGEGVIEARFNDLLLPYLLELRDNFTKAQLTELLANAAPQGDLRDLAPAVRQLFPEPTYQVGCSSSHIWLHRTDDPNRLAIIR